MPNQRSKSRLSGVETEEQQPFLREQGCDELQGFLPGRPGSIGPLKAYADFPGLAGSSKQALTA